MKYWLALFFLLFVWGCASTKQEDNNKESGITIPENKLPYFLELKTTMNASYGGDSRVFTAKIILAGNDSASMNVYGPFGVVLGKLYSDSSNFTFLNILENTVYTGKPTLENFQRAMQIPVSFSDLIHILRSEVPGNKNDYKYVKNVEESGYSLFRRNGGNFIEFVTFGTAQKELKQIQRKDLGNEAIMNVAFDDYTTFNNLSLAKGATIDFAKAAFKLTLENDDVNAIDNGKPVLSFKIPSSAKIVKF